MTDTIDAAFRQWAADQLAATQQDLLPFDDLRNRPQPVNSKSRGLRFAALAGAAVLVVAISVAVTQLSHRSGTSKAGTVAGDRFRAADKVKPDPRAGIGRTWGLVQVSDQTTATVTVIEQPASFEFDFAYSGQFFFASNGHTVLSGSYDSTPTGFQVTYTASLLMGWGTPAPGSHDDSYITAGAAMDSLLRGSVVARMSGGYLDLHTATYKLVLRDLGPA